MKLTVKNILAQSSYQVTKLSDKMLSKQITILNSAANKRIKRAQKKGLSSGTLERAIESGAFYKRKYKDRYDMENAYVRVKMFLESSTSSVRGIKSAQRKTFEGLAKKINETLPKNEKINYTDWTKDSTDQELKDINDLVWTQIDKLAEDKRLGITKKERYSLAEYAYNVTTRSERPITSKRYLFSKLKEFYKTQYDEFVKEDEEIELTEEEKKIASMYQDFT